MGPVENGAWPHLLYEKSFYFCKRDFFESKLRPAFDAKTHILWILKLAFGAFHLVCLLLVS